MGNHLCLCEDRLLETAFTETAGEYAQTALEAHWQHLALELPHEPDDFLQSNYEEPKDVSQTIRHFASALKRTAEVVAVATFTLYKATLDTSSSDSESSEDSLEEDYDPAPSDQAKKMDFSALE